MTENIWDVVIVGAGLSGLSAARLLQKRNPELKILILEGKDRVGGRTVAKDLPAANGVDRWDLGGQWVCSTQTHIMELIQELGVEVYPQYSTGKKVHHMGGIHGKIHTYSTSIPKVSPLLLFDLTQLLWKIDRLTATVCVEDPPRTPNAVELDSMTVHSYLERHAWTQELRELMGLSSRAVFGMEPSQMSFLYFLMYAAAAGNVLALLETTPGCAQEFRVKGGAQRLSECLAERVGLENVRLGTAVTAIWQDGEWANVKTAKHSFLCKAVIVTCPPHLAAKIQYQPALPKQREALTQNMPVGHMIKFIVTYQTAFWRENGFSGEILAQPTAECPFSVTYDATTPSSNAALVGFIAGQQASQWSCREVEERRGAVVASLVRYLGPEAASFIHYEEKDWAKEDYSGGCPVNVMAPGLLTYYHPSLRKPCGRIHWGGTETATRWCGYMSGAVQSGQRAALEVLAELCPDTLTQKEREEEAQRRRTEEDVRLDSPVWLQATESSALAYLSRAALVATFSVGTALLLARPQLCQEWISLGQGWMWRGLAKCNLFRW